MCTPNTKANNLNPHPQPNQVQMPATPPPQPDQVEIPQEYELMELDAPEDIPDLVDVPEEVLSEFDARAHSVLNFQLLTFI